uniref:Uncharacterized protein n=1 Tax=Chromera velia CCMP2878 TaxID=1169474 RepID=A0A0G4HB36_9ALVE|eukprot:Cvel_25740.t1-p1 / transcript=Cvel_25740.t1 / gene=Cvel_25740 / organism=Chromera_velia_CCMP2878 / gene_product=hypothetical protein / transcript_product=hypothetical protein / location=Cvel_scaffold2960:19010-20011(+) / protein_length=334 / sequence_SO=supercontig / SO=protein_coding / is_pseudo=false
MGCSRCCTRFCNCCKNFSRTVPLIALIGALMAVVGLSLFFSGLSAIAPDSVVDQETMQQVEDLIAIFVTADMIYAAVVVAVALFTGCTFGPCRRIFYETCCKYLMCCCGQLVLLILFIIGVAIQVVQYALVLASGALFTVSAIFEAVCKVVNPALVQIHQALERSGWGTFAPRLNGRLDVEVPTFDCGPLTERTQKCLELVLAACFLALSGLLLCVAIWGSLKSIQFEVTNSRIVDVQPKKAEGKEPASVAPVEEGKAQEGPTSSQNTNGLSGVPVNRLTAFLPPYSSEAGLIERPNPDSHSACRFLPSVTVKEGEVHSVLQSCGDLVGIPDPV